MTIYAPNGVILAQLSCYSGPVSKKGDEDAVQLLPGSCAGRAGLLSAASEQKHV